MSQQDIDLIGSGEAAVVLGWSLAKVKREAKAGRLPHHTKLPAQTGAYLFDRSVVEAHRDAAAAV